MMAKLNRNHAVVVETLFSKIGFRCRAMLLHSQKMTSLYFNHLLPTTLKAADGMCFLIDCTLNFVFLTATAIYGG